ncbi:hypothetical protein HBH25_21775 [Pseudomonas sp. hsmgli-8]|uniref:Uncharacterized protein n=1 Tax=Pseudomonas quercus TaxID=2722792 RepID=A0ABX0YMS3_9PSED|nr:hypothetical protein [Pseudomonas quercus]NJP03469.1 hypothetical protein [Pseudomonas quercus]
MKHSSPYQYLHSVFGFFDGGSFTKNSLSWKFFGILAMVACLLLATTFGLARLFVPSAQEIADLKSTVADLEQRGGRIQLTNCGDTRRLCAKVNLKAKVNGDTYGKDGEWMILQGY